MDLIISINSAINGVLFCIFAALASFGICTLTGLSLLCSGIHINYGIMGDTALNVQALGSVFGMKGGSLAWDIADTLNGLMAIPNLIAVLALSGVVVQETKRHFADLAEKKKEKKTS